MDYSFPPLRILQHLLLIANQFAFYYFHILKSVRPPSPMEGRWAGLWDADLQVADCRFTLISRSVGTHWLREPGSAAASLRHFLDRYRESGTIGHDGGIVVYERK